MDLHSRLNYYIQQFSCAQLRIHLSLRFFRQRVNTETEWSSLWIHWQLYGRSGPVDKLQFKYLTRHYASL